MDADFGNSFANAKSNTALFSRWWQLLKRRLARCRCVTVPALHSTSPGDDLRGDAVWLLAQVDNNHKRPPKRRIGKQ